MSRVNRIPDGNSSIQSDMQEVARQPVYVKGVDKRGSWQSVSARIAGANRRSSYLGNVRAAVPRKEFEPPD